MICLPIYPSKIMPVMVQKSFLNLNSNILQVYSFPLFQVQVVSGYAFLVSFTDFRKTRICHPISGHRLYNFIPS